MIPSHVEITDTKPIPRLLTWEHITRTPGVYRAKCIGVHDGDFVLVGQDLVPYYLNTRGPYIHKILEDPAPDWYETKKYHKLNKELAVTVPEGTLIFS